MRFISSQLGMKAYNKSLEKVQLLGWEKNFKILNSFIHLYKLISQDMNNPSSTVNSTDNFNTKQATSSSKKYVWKFLFISILIASSFLFNKVYTFQTHEHFKDIPQGTIYDLIMYTVPFAVIFSLFDLLIHRIFDPLCAKYYITTERYTEPQDKIKRSYTLVKWIYCIVYYIIVSIWAYKIMLGTKFMPTWLGGEGGFLTMAEDAPLIPGVSLQMKIFYICQCGKHLSRFFVHVFIRSEGNFFEFALHHGLSVFLIVFSYLTNQWLIGVFVLLIHDYSDFALITARAYKDCRYMVKWLLDVIYVHAFIAWIGCRIFLFSYCCIYASVRLVLYVPERLTQFQGDTLIVLYAFMGCMMFGLQILHLYWTYFIAESFVAIKVSPKLAKHTYD